MSSPSSPIADLTYRNYDGPLAPPTYRWWPIAKMSMRMAVKKRAFWVLGVLSGWWYLILSAIFYFADVSNTSVEAQNRFFKTVVWKDQFLDAFSRSQLFLLLIALLIGVGAIANDNRANALLVYLSKPTTKLDYLIGKWLGIFIPMMCVVAVPTLLFYADWALSYRQYGILSDDPWLIVKLLALCPVTAFFHASVSLGISSLFDQGRTAGAIYAGLYFMSFIFTGAVGVARAVAHRSGELSSHLINTLYYFSIDGIQIALAKNILGTDGSSFLRRQSEVGPTPAPSALLFFGIYLVICALMMSLAWSRIKAVEVVGS
jgi:ABC-2 type transport system permease protein